jgi:DNA-binding ferritin-like protein
MPETALVPIPGDPASLDLATRRLAVHEKTLWMLRVTAADGPGG